MAKFVRIALLMIVLLAVAQGAWNARARTTDWSETLRVAVYPINADASAAADAYIGGLRRPVVRPQTADLREQARGYNLPPRDPIKVDLAPRVTALPRNGGTATAREISWLK